MNPHLNEAQFSGYIHRTLTDAERETLNQHLAACAECRARLDTHKALHDHIRHTLKAELRTAQPANMAYPPLLSGNTGRGFAPFLNPAVALVGMAMALISVLGYVEHFFTSSPSQSTTTLPLLACFLFSIPVTANYHAGHTPQPRQLLTGGLTLILWLGMTIIGLYEIIVIREMLYRIYARFWHSYWAAVVLGQWAVIIMGALWLVFIIATGEYHYHHINQRSSWKLFGWTILTEAGILLIAAVI